MAIPNFHSWLGKLLYGDSSAQNLWHQYLKLKSFTKEEAQELIILFDEIIKVKNRDYTQACFLRACCNVYGLDEVYDYDFARNLFEEAAQKNHTGAMIELGLMHAQGLGGIVNEIKAFELFLQAEELGDYAALNNIVNLFSPNKREEITFVNDEEIFSETEEDIGALINQAIRLQEEKKLAEALQLYKKAGNTDYIATLNHLGDLYLYSLHSRESSYKLIDTNHQRAIFYYDQAISLNDTKAMIERAFMHRYGYGGPINPEAARALYKKAINLGNLHACGFLGDLEYYNPQANIQDTIALLETAISVSNTKAMVLRAEIHLKQDPPERKQALELLEFAMLREEPIAYYVRAEMFSSGIYEPRNFSKAYTLYLQFEKARQEKMSFAFFAINVITHTPSLNHILVALRDLSTHRPENQDIIYALIEEFKKTIISVIDQSNPHIFLTRFPQSLNSLNNISTHHRQIWKPVMFNLGIALTGIGLLILIIRAAHELLCTPKQQSHVHLRQIFFCAKTHTERLIEKTHHYVNQVDFSSILAAEDLSVGANPQPA